MVNIQRWPLIIAATFLLWAPYAVQAQAVRVQRVGVLANGSAATSPTVDAFREALHELGHVEGQNLVLDIRWAEGRFERMPELAAELVGGKPDVLVASVPQGVRAVRNATSSIPLVLVACDPAESLVQNIARPSGHITGVTCMSSDLTPKRLQLLKEALPATRRVAVLYNSFDPAKAEEVRDMSAPARALGLTLVPLEVASAEAFDGAVARAVREHADALFVLPDPLTLLTRQRITALATKHHLPSFFGFREFVEVGGLISYGTMQKDLYRRAAAHVDKVLHGAKPMDVPVEQASRFELVVNLKTAAVLGLSIPEAFLARADEVIR